MYKCAFINRSCYCTGTGSVINALRTGNDIHSAVMAKPTVTVRE